MNRSGAFPAVWTLGAALLLASLQPALADVPDRVPSVGVDGPGSDACGSIGRVTGLDPASDFFLSVRSSPEPDSVETDRLDRAELVWLCEASGEWQGIVFAEKGKDFGDCRVSNPVAQPEPYSGPCRHGWVLGRYIQLTAG